MSTSITSQLTQSLRDELLSGSFKPGQQLRLNQLSAQFDVSLSPLREAMSRLAAEGLLIAQDQRGYQVAPVSLKNHREITSLRVMLEPCALRASLEQGTDEWEVALVAAHHRLQLIEKRAAQDASALVEWETRHREFHLTLIGAGQMPVLTQFCEKLLDFSDRYRRIFLRTRQLDRNIPDEHEAILDAVLKRDQETACRLLTQHIERTAANISTMLQEAEEGGGTALTA